MVVIEFHRFTLYFQEVLKALRTTDVIIKLLYIMLDVLRLVSTVITVFLFDSDRIPSYYNVTKIVQL